MRKINLCLVFVLVLTFNFSEWIPLGQLSTFNRVFAAEPGLLFSEDFGKDAGRWESTGGNWEVESGEYSGTGEGESVAGDEGWSDYVYEVRLKTTDPGDKSWNVGIVLFRYADNSNRYFVLLHANKMLELGKRQDGEHKPGLKSVQEVADPKQWNVIRIETKKDNIKIYINGELKIDYTDPKPILKGKIGFWENGNSTCHYDDVKVWGDYKKVPARIAKDGKTVIGIFKDKVPVVESKPSNPDYLQEILKKAGYTTKFLKGEDLVNPDILNRDNIEIIVLPYGSSFPLEAVENFKKYLKSGGSFFSIGGYAFDNLYSLTTGKVAGGNFIANPGFEEELEGGEKTGPPQQGLSNIPPGVIIERDASVKHQGKFSLRYEVPQEVNKGWFGPFWRLEAGHLGDSPMEARDKIKEGDVLQAAVFVKTSDTRDGAGAYFACNYYKSTGERISYDQSSGLLGTNDWTEIKFITKEVPRGTSYVTFNLLLYGHGIAWFDDVKVEKYAVGLNTGSGKARDRLEISAEQIPVFDAGFKLENTVLIKTNSDQNVIEKNFELAGQFTGYAASAMTSSNNSAVLPDVCRRWIPLINAYDRYGRLRGSIGSLVYNYKGPYKGSAWAYFGVNNKNLFFPENRDMERVFVDIVNSMVRKTFLYDFQTNYACYRQGETAGLSVNVRNYGNTEQKFSVKIQVLDYDEKKVYYEEVKELSPGADSYEEVKFNPWKPEKFELDFYRVKVILMSEGKVIDKMDSGFVVRDERIISKGFPLKLKNGYFCKGEEPLFLMGTSHTGVVFASRDENPLVWAREFQKMCDHGINQIWPLHFFWATGGIPKSDKLLQKAEVVFRRLDAIVQLCQKYGIVVHFPLDVVPVCAPDEDLAAARDIIKSLVTRYKDVPGIMWDISAEISVGTLSNVPYVQRLYNEYLNSKYGSIPEAVLPPTAFKPAHFIVGGDWDDSSVYELNSFRVWLARRWANAIASAIREVSDKPISFGTYRAGDGSSLEQWLTVDLLDFSEGSCYWPRKDIGRELKFLDHRSVGKTFAMDEFGAKIHPAWSSGRSLQSLSLVGCTTEEAVDWYLLVGHYVFGMGAGFLRNWCWKDLNGCIFPWGMNYPGDLVSKDTLLTYRNMSFFFQPWRLTYSPPSVYLVIPDNNRLGGKATEVIGGILNSIDLLFGCKVDFGIINDSSLDKFLLSEAKSASGGSEAKFRIESPRETASGGPKTAKALIYPLPYCPSDRTYELLKKFVEEGGNLYISGDISYDPLSRKRTRVNRLLELCGVKFLDENYANIDYRKVESCQVKPVQGMEKLEIHKGYPCIKVEPGHAEVLARDENGSPVTMLNRFGKGLVFYTTEPVELYISRGDLPWASKIYKVFLESAGIKRIDLQPDDPLVHVLKLRTLNDETIYVLINADNSAAEKKIVLTDSGFKTELTLKGMRPALLAVGKQGELKAIEAEGEVKFNDITILATTGHTMILSRDGESIDKSKSLMIMPSRSGSLELKTDAQWKSLKVQAGEFRDGRWITYEEIPVEKSGDRIKLEINPGVANSLILILSKN